MSDGRLSEFKPIYDGTGGVILAYSDNEKVVLSTFYTAANKMIRLTSKLSINLLAASYQF